MGGKIGSNVGYDMGFYMGTLKVPIWVPIYRDLLLVEFPHDYRGWINFQPKWSGFSITLSEKRLNSTDLLTLHFKFPDLNF